MKIFLLQKPVRIGRSGRETAAPEKIYPLAPAPPQSGSAVVDFTRCMAKRDVTFLRGTAAIRRL